MGKRVQHPAFSTPSGCSTNANVAEETKSKHGQNNYVLYEKKTF